jgi:hypothetical protein
MRYTDKMLHWLQVWYRHWPSKKLHTRFNKKFRVHTKYECLKSYLSRKGIYSGRSGCFEKGFRPWNYGTKGICKRNRGIFKRGNVPKNLRPLGATRYNSKYGYVLIKVAEKNPYNSEPTRYRPKHHIVWERFHGPIPKGHLILFKDGNPLNFRKSNLLCITKSQNVRLNQLHYKDQPAELKPSVLAMALLKDRLGKIKKGR